MSQSRIYAPLRKRMLMVFDVETTGLLPKQPKNGQNLGLVSPIDSYPYIIQLSFVLYDLFEQRIVKSYDSYVNIPEFVEIPTVVSQLTGITKEICSEKGKNIVTVIDEFYDAYMYAETIIAHNMDFDEKMIQIELQRNRSVFLEKAPYCFTIFSKIYEKLKGVDRYCTMKQGTDVCAIVVGDRVSKKWPKLSELHKKLFDEVPDGLHNSMVDVSACLRCYLKMRHGISS